MLSILFYRVLNSILLLFKPTLFVSSPEDINSIIRASWNPELDNDREKIWVLVIGKNQRLLSVKIISIGCDSEVTVQTRDLGLFLLRFPTEEIALVHNHPSNENYPSKKDLVFTKKLSNYLSSFGYYLKDHLIVTKDSYYSLRENNKDLFV